MLDVLELPAEVTPADVAMIGQPEAVKLLKQRAPELISQYDKTPEVLGKLVQQIEALEPLPLLPDEPKETPYPTEALLGMDSTVLSIAEQTKMPAALVGQCALGLANSIIHGLVDINKPGNPSPKPVSLFLLSGADSGEGKTWVDDILFSGLREKAYAKDLEYNVHLKEYLLAKAAYQAEQDKIKKNKQIKTQAERLQALQELEQPEVPMNPRLQCADFTIEGLGRAFREGCTRLSAMSDEGAIIFEGHTLNNDRRSAVMGRVCNLWDGKRWDNDRGQIENNYSLYGRRFAISVTTQPDILKRIIADTAAFNQGFLPRFLLAMPDTRIADRSMIDTDWHNVPEVVSYWDRLAALYAITPNTMSNDRLSLNPRALNLEVAARQLHKEYGNKCFKLAAGDYTPIRPMVLKAEDNLLRLAATLAVWNDSAATTIKPEYVEAAGYLMDYHLKETLRIVEFSALTSDDSDLSLASRLLAWIKKENHCLVYSQLLAQKAPKREMRKGAVIDTLMSLLVEYGHAIWLEGKPVIDNKPRMKAWFITG